MLMLADQHGARDLRHAALMFTAANAAAFLAMPAWKESGSHSHSSPALLPSALQSSPPHRAPTTDGQLCAWRRWRAAPLAPRSAGAQRVPKGLCCRAAARARARVVFFISL